MGLVQEFRSAHGKDEALSWLEELGSDAQVLAGGTDVMIQYLRGDIGPGLFLHIERISELRGIRADGRVDVGPLTTHFVLGRDPLIGQWFPAIAEAARTVGGWQTQTVGTLGGNICNASPAADLTSPLLVADAHVTLESTGRKRTMHLGDFLLGRRETARAPDELLTKISIEPTSGRTGEAYLKLGRRGAMEVAIVGLAVRLTLDAEETITDARVAVCSVAPRPYRALDAEAALVGRRPERDVLGEAGRLLAASASPIDDVRSLARYRLATLAPLLERAVGICTGRARDRA